MFEQRCGSGVTPSPTRSLCFSSYIMEPLVSYSLSSPHDEGLASRIEAQLWNVIGKLTTRGEKKSIKGYLCLLPALLPLSPSLSLFFSLFLSLREEMFETTRCFLNSFYSLCVLTHNTFTHTKQLCCIIF